MNINDFLIDSKNKTGLQKEADKKILWLIIIPFFIQVEEFVLKNKGDEANPIDKIISIACEVIVSIIIGLILSPIFLIYIGTIKSNFNLYENYTPYTEIPYYTWLLSFAIASFFIVIIFQNFKNNFSIITQIKKILLIIKFLSYQNKKIRRFIVYFVEIVFCISLFYISILIMTLAIVPLRSISIMGHILILAISFSITYIIKVEFETNEWKKVLRKIIFILVSVILTVSVNIFDLQKYEYTSSLGMLKIFSFLFLVSFQCANVVPLAKDIAKLLLKNIEEQTELYTNTYIQGETANDVKKDYYVITYLSELYNFIPNDQIDTFTNYYHRFIEGAKISYKKLKMNRKTSRKTFFVLIGNVIFTVGMLLMFLLINYEFGVISLYKKNLLLISLLILICFLSIPSTSNDKNFIKTLKNDVVNKARYILPTKKNINEVEKQGLELLREKIKPVIKKIIYLNIILCVFALACRVLFIYGFERIRILVACVILISVFIYSRNIDDELTEFNIYYSKYTPKHWTCHLLKAFMRIGLILMGFTSLFLIFFALKSTI